MEERGPSGLMTVREVQEELRLSRATVDRLFAAGELRSFKVKGSRRVRRQDLEAFVESRLVPGVHGGHDVMARPS